MKKKGDYILERVLIVIMSVLVIDVLWQVASRYILASPSSFTDELAGFLLIWVGVLGAAYVTGKREHLAIDLLIQRSGPERRTRLLFIVDLSIALFAMFVMIIGGMWLVITRFQFEVSSAALQLPLGYVYMVVPVSGLLMFYYSLHFLITKNREEV